jgi:hypothetical protein
MTGPRRESPLSPVRRRGGSASVPVESYTEPEIARGQSDAVLGALGRMQLRLDMLAREQSEALGMITQVLEQVLDRLAALEAPAEDLGEDSAPEPEDY